MLSKQNRIKKSSAFQRAYKKGKHLRGSCCKLVFFNRHDNDPARFGIVIPAKLGNAVKRNRAKRQVREVLRAGLPKVPKSLDIVIILWGLDFAPGKIQADVEALVNKVSENLQL